MSAPIVVVQFSDLHVGATWAGEHSRASLSLCVEAALRLPDRVDAVVLTGDLTEHAADDEYEVVKTLTARIDAPLYVAPGNQDMRAAMRRHFNLSGAADAPIQYAADVGQLRLIVLDSTLPGKASGELPSERLAWLDGELAASSHRPTLVAVHHPPVPIGIPAWDRIGLPATDSAALAGILSRHPQVRGVVAGHVHRAIVSDLAGRPALTAPSTYVQADLDLRATKIAFGEGPPGFVVHTLAGGELISHVKPVGDLNEFH